MGRFDIDLLEAFVEFLKYQYHISLEDHKIEDEVGRTMYEGRILIVRKSNEHSFELFSPIAGLASKVVDHFDSIVKQVSKEEEDE